MRKIKSVCLALFACLMLCIIARADSGISVLETYTSEDSVTIYVRGTDSQQEVTADVGTGVAKKVDSEAISDSAVPMQTLVMVDNSLSIKESDRTKIADLLQNIISDRIPREEIAIATFDEEVRYLCEYTSEYTELKNAIDSISYQDQETYLTDVLYDLISTEFIENDDVFRRIIVISDGVDNKSLGYTKEDLHDLLEKRNVPIYSFGCSNKKKTNNEYLENMFSLSRRTGGYSFVMDDLENTIDALSLLNEDRNVVKYTVLPDDSQLDGSSKAVKLKIGESEISVECRMPQKIKQEEIKEPEPTPTPVPTAEKEIVVQEEEIVDEEPAEFPSWIKYAIIGGIALVVILGGVLATILIIRNNKKKNSFQGMDSFLQPNPATNPPSEKTEIIESFDNQKHSDQTCEIWNSPQTYHVILSDVHSPAKTFQLPLTSSIVIGRKVGCDVVLDYDKSVSGKHCQILTKNGKFYVKDMQSANGTFINGSRVISEVELFSGNTLKLGRLEIKFEVR